jgi:tetratricopeptide (TPR) repeat protein
MGSRASMPIDFSPREIIAQAKHQQGLELLEKQQLAGALRLIGESPAQEETCERWNDWAVAQFTAGQLVEAEHGFRYALELDPENRDVAGNLGVLLVECQRENEAIPFLAKALAGAGGTARSGTADVLLTFCRDTVATWLAEFKTQVQEEPIPLEKVPRWPLTKYALRLAQLGALRPALEMIYFNRHFQPADRELIKMRTCIEILLRGEAASSQFGVSIGAVVARGCEGREL